MVSHCLHGRGVRWEDQRPSLLHTNVSLTLLRITHSSCFIMKASFTKLPEHLHNYVGLHISKTE